MSHIKDVNATYGKSTNITSVEHKVSRSKRAEALGVSSKFSGCTVWFTGLSGAGKTTLSFAVEAACVARGIPCYGLDGDNCRTGLCKNLSFSPQDREENIRRVGEVARLFADGGIIALASFISPFKRDREMVRLVHEASGLPFFEIHVATPLHICERRDPKGLYKKARAGIIKGFTGIDADYEAPSKADLLVGSKGESIEESLQSVIDFLEARNIIPRSKSSREPLVKNWCLMDREKKVQESQSYPLIELQPDGLEWLYALAHGWASPLRGFMIEEELLQTIHHKSVREQSGACYDSATPVVLPCNEEQKAVISSAEKLRLVHKGKLVGVMSGPKVFSSYKQQRRKLQYWSFESKSEEVQALMECPDFNVGGSVEVFEDITFDDGLDHLRRAPQWYYENFQTLGADAVVSFPCNGPINEEQLAFLKSTHLNMRKTFRNPAILIQYTSSSWNAENEAIVRGSFSSSGITHVIGIIPGAIADGAAWLLWISKCAYYSGATHHVVGHIGPPCQSATLAFTVKTCKFCGGRMEFIDFNPKRD